LIKPIVKSEISVGNPSRISFIDIYEGVSYDYVHWLLIVAYSPIRIFIAEKAVFLDYVVNIYNTSSEIIGKYRAVAKKLLIDLLNIYW